jgi:hypothetical protein
MLEVAGGNGDVVEVAKPHGLVPLRMVPGRPDGAKGVVEFPRHDPPGDVQDAAHRQECGFVGVHAHLIVGVVEGSVAGQADLFKTTDVARVVNRFDPLEVGTNRRDNGHLVQQAGVLDAVEHRGEAISRLRVVGPRVVKQIPEIMQIAGSFHRRPRPGFRFESGCPCRQGPIATRSGG